MISQKEYRLRRVKRGLSILLICCTYLVIMSVLIVIAIITDGLPTVMTLVVMLGAGTSLVWAMVKYSDRLLVKDDIKVAFMEDHFMVNSQRYRWEDVEWHRDVGSKFFMGIAFGMKGSRTIRFYYATTESQAWTDMISDFKDILATKSVRIRAYFDSVGWRRFARIILLINFMLFPVLVFLGIETKVMVPVVLAFLFLSLPIVLTIFMSR